MATTEPLLSIGEVAARAGLRTSHIRYYERVGVLPLPDRLGGQRRYHPEVLHRLAIVDVAQRAGFTLEEIRELTGPQPPGHAAGERLRELAQCKRPDIEALIQRAQAVKTTRRRAPRRPLVAARDADAVRGPAAGPLAGAALTHATR